MFQDHLNRLRLIWALNTGTKRKQISQVMQRLRPSLKNPPQLTMTPQEQARVRTIRTETADANRNNLTRTMAYLAFYQRNPEIHWALLAHLVSRNGGWNMTDLQGDWFTRLDPDERSRKDLFAMLERANWLIFHDAYPQLLLYQESKRTNQNLCHLLPAFEVSRFMPVMWSLFMSGGDSALLTKSLIINEQNYIEARVIQNPDFMSTMSSMKVQVQSWLNLNHVLLPYRRGHDVRVAGTRVSQFGSVNDRIQTGLRLYENLYQDRLLHQAIVRWANEVEHTGSRSDFWPDVFTPRRPTPDPSHYRPRFIAHAPGHPGIFSPQLADAWPDVKHQSAEPGEWFKDFRHLIYLFDDISRQPSDYTDAYVDSIRTMENIIVAKEKAQAALSTL